MLKTVCVCVASGMDVLDSGVERLCQGILQLENFCTDKTYERTICVCM